MSIEQKHTREPWQVFERRHPFEIAEHKPFTPDGGIKSEHVEYLIGTAWIHPQLKDHDVIVGLSVGVGELNGPPVYMEGLRREDARRIVAAVNACAGIETAVLEAIGPAWRGKGDAIKSLAHGGITWDCEPPTTYADKVLEALKEAMGTIIILTDEDWLSPDFKHRDTLLRVREAVNIIQSANEAARKREGNRDC